jgi:Ca2+-transporting ATPase
VNDAPALKAADIGCAMGIAGTDVAKGAAEMVLTDDNFMTIVKAVKEGRGIYINIRKAAQFLLSSNIGEIIVMLTALLLGFAPPLLAIHLLWVNLVTDSLPAIALGLDPVEETVMSYPPVKKHSNLFSGGLWQKIATQGIMIGLLSLIAFGIGVAYYDSDGAFIIGRTMAFAVLSISQLVHAFNMRSDSSIFLISLWSNKYLVYSFFAGLALQVFVIMHPLTSAIFKVQPLSAVQWLIVTTLCILPIFIVEIEKYVDTCLFHRQKRELFIGKRDEKLV